MNKINNLSGHFLSKVKFRGILNNIKKQHKKDNKAIKAYNKILGEDSYVVNPYDYSNIYNSLIELLEINFNDKGKWIEYFIYELDFGKKYTKDSVLSCDGKSIDVSDAGKLYDLLIHNLNDNLNNSQPNQPDLTKLQNDLVNYRLRNYDETKEVAIQKIKEAYISVNFIHESLNDIILVELKEHNDETCDLFVYNDNGELVSFN